MSNQNAARATPMGGPRAARRGVALALIVVLIGAAGCGPRERRARAIANVENLGGSYAEGQPTYPAWTAPLREVAGDAPFKRLAGPSDYSCVDLWCRPATDGDVARLSALPDLAQLNLSGTVVTNDGLAPVGRLRRLKSLELCGTEVTDAGLAHLKGLTRLGRLRLNNCDITDAAIPHLQAIPSPDMYVHLQRTKVTTVRAGVLWVHPAAGGGDVRAGGKVVVEGSFAAAEVGYVPDDVDVSMMRNDEDSDEAKTVAYAAVRPVRRVFTPWVYDFRVELGAPDRAGLFWVEAQTLAKLRRLKAFYTTGFRRLEVLPPRAEPAKEDCEAAGRPVRASAR